MSHGGPQLTLFFKILIMWQNMGQLWAKMMSWSFTFFSVHWTIFADRVTIRVRNVTGSSAFLERMFRLQGPSSFLLQTWFWLIFIHFNKLFSFKNSFFAIFAIIQFCNFILTQQAEYPAKKNRRGFTLLIVLLPWRKELTLYGVSPTLKIWQWGSEICLSSGTINNLIIKI